MKDNNNSNILFKYKNLNVESFVAFNNNDFLIFFNNNSIIYDGKTLQPKKIFNLPSSFILLDQEEYSIVNDLDFELYRFNQDRTSSTIIQKIKPIGHGMKITKMSNGDILVYSLCLLTNYISLYRKNNNNYYDYQSQIFIDDLNEIIELNDTEFLGYKYNLSSEILIFKVLNKDNYKIKRENQIKCICGDNKKRIYLSQSIIKVSDDKLLSLGGNNIYIFNAKNLDLETTIKISLNKNILKILVRPKGNILLLCREINYTNYNEREKFYIKNIRINYLNNDIDIKSEKDITDKIGDNKTLFEFYNYANDGLAVIIDKKELIIFNNYDD